MTLNEDPFKVDYDDNDDVTALKKKIKEEMKPNLNDFATNLFIAWQCKEPKLLANANVNELEDILHKVDFSNHRKAVWLASAKMVASLKLSKNEVLLVQIPGKYPHSCYNMIQFNAVKEPPSTALLAAKKQVWCLAIKHDMTIDRDPLKVDYDDIDDVAALKEKVKGKKGISLPADELAVWQCKEPKLLADANVDELEDILHKVDFSDRRKAVRLASAKMVASLELSKNEVLLVQMPGK